MANNNLVLTVVLVAAALLLFNGGLSGQAVISRSCSSPGERSCIYNTVVECGEDGRVHEIEVCKHKCNVLQEGGQTTSPTTAFCSVSYSGSTMPAYKSSSTGWGTA